MIPQTIDSQPEVHVPPEGLGVHRGHKSEVIYNRYHFKVNLDGLGFRKDHSNLYIQRLTVFFYLSSEEYEEYLIGLGCGV